MLCTVHVTTNKTLFLKFQCLLQEIITILHNNDCESNQTHVRYIVYIIQNDHVESAIQKVSHQLIIWFQFYSKPCQKRLKGYIAKVILLPG